MVHAFNHRYDDGDSDKRLKEKYVKGLDSGSESDGSTKDKLREGDKVTARYRGLEKYYKGVIRRAHSDGTFSIDCATRRPGCRRVLFIFHAICPRRRRRREGEPRQGALHQEAVQFSEPLALAEPQPQSEALEGSERGR